MYSKLFSQTQIHFMFIVVVEQNKKQNKYENRVDKFTYLLEIYRDSFREFELYSNK